MTNEFIDYFHKDTARTFPTTKISHMSKMVGFMASEDDDTEAPILLGNIKDIMQTGVVADYLKAHIFYGKDKDIVEEFNNLIEGIKDECPVQIGDQSVQIIHGLLGIVSESAELARAVLLGLTNDCKYDVVNFKEEIGDVVVYASVICNALGFTLEDAMKANIAKRAKRFPDGFTEFHAVNRDTVAERKILEEGSGY